MIFKKFPNTLPAAGIIRTINNKIQQFYNQFNNEKTATELILKRHQGQIEATRNALKTRAPGAAAVPNQTKTTDGCSSSSCISVLSGQNLEDDRIVSYCPSRLRHDSDSDLDENERYAWAGLTSGQASCKASGDSDKPYLKFINKPTNTNPKRPCRRRRRSLDNKLDLRESNRFRHRHDTRPCQPNISASSSDQTLD